MVKTAINYAKSPAPHADAVADVQDYFGERYDRIAAEMKAIKDCEQFMFWCGLAGVRGFPVKAWYEHFHGEGTFQPTRRP